MVAYQDASLSGLRFNLEPKGFRRLINRFHIPIPYFHFQKPEWDLTIERVSEENQPEAIFWYLKFPDNRVTGGRVELPEMKKGEKETKKIGGKLISPIGTTSVCVTTDKQIGKNKPSLREIAVAKHHTLCTFRSFTRTELFMSFIIGLIASIITQLGLWKNLLKWLMGILKSFLFSVPP